MKRYSVRNKKTGLITNEWHDDYADDKYREPSFGKDIRWETEVPEGITPLATRERITPAVVGTDEDGKEYEVYPETKVLEYQLPAEFEIITKDLTIENAEKLAKRNARLAQLKALLDLDDKSDITALELKNGFRLLIKLLKDTDSNMADLLVRLAAQQK